MNLCTAVAIKSFWNQQVKPQPAWAFCKIPETTEFLTKGFFDIIAISFTS